MCGLHGNNFDPSQHQMTHSHDGSKCGIAYRCSAATITSSPHVATGKPVTGTQQRAACTGVRRTGAATISRRTRMVMRMWLKMCTSSPAWTSSSTQVHSSLVQCCGLLNSPSPQHDTRRVR